MKKIQVLIENVDGTVMILTVRQSTFSELIEDLAADETVADFRAWAVAE